MTDPRGLPTTDAVAAAAIRKLQPGRYDLRVLRLGDPFMYPEGGMWFVMKVEDEERVFVFSPTGPKTEA